MSEITPTLHSLLENNPEIITALPTVAILTQIEDPVFYAEALQAELGKNRYLSVIIDQEIPPLFQSGRDFQALQKLGSAISRHNCVILICSKEVNIADLVTSVKGKQEQVKERAVQPQLPTIILTSQEVIPFPIESDLLVLENIVFPPSRLSTLQSRRE